MSLEAAIHIDICIVVQQRHTWIAKVYLIGKISVNGATGIV
jgi:hypothetical protein